MGAHIFLLMRSENFFTFASVCFFKNIFYKFGIVMKTVLENVLFCALPFHVVFNVCTVRVPFCRTRPSFCTHSEFNTRARRKDSVILFVPRAVVVCCWAPFEHPRYDLKKKKELLPSIAENIIAWFEYNVIATQAETPARPQGVGLCGYRGVYETILKKVGPGVATMCCGC